jgi:hypothetical protein
MGPIASAGTIASIAATTIATTAGVTTARPDGYKTLGTILGAGAGALIGREIDDGVECR